MTSQHLIHLEEQKFTNRTILIDVSNFLLNKDSSVQKFRFLCTLLTNFDPNQIIAIADANLPYRMEIGDLIHENLIYLVPARTQADVFLIQLAHQLPDAIIITNDLFREFNSVFTQDLELVRFMIVGDTILFDLDLTKEPKAPMNQPLEQNSEPSPELKNSEYEFLERIFHSQGELELFS
jgi:hypothetical protein